jgi:hypothetical protein
MSKARPNDHFPAIENQGRRYVRPLILASLSLCMFVSSTALSQTATLRVAVPTHQTVQERAATAMFVEEAAKRTPGSVAASVSAGQLKSAGAGDETVLLAQRDAMALLLPEELISKWRKTVDALHTNDHAEGFSIVSLPWKGGHVIVVAGNDVRGELFGVGWLLRNASYAGNVAMLPLNARLFSSPEKPVRGHQIGYRFKNNTYDAWTLAQFEQHIRDLAVFGTNTIQVISPASDDEKASPLFPAPAIDVFYGLSRLCDKYGLDFDLYYPEMRANYKDPTAVSAELKDFEALVSKTQRIDALYVPGGDPGHTPPELLFPLLEQEVEILHKYHPAATVWVSAQGFDRERYAKFYDLLFDEPKWLTGVFFGPQSRDSFEVQRRNIPAKYPLQFYPDIAHTMHSQFPVPEWDPIFALTESREPVDPRPKAFAEIYRHYASLNSGFVTYSEGVNDDVNKMLWSQLGWSTQTSVDGVLAEYARYFLHREGAQQALAVNAIKGLEEDWNGPLLQNQQIAKTKAALDELQQESTPAQLAKNWQWESLVYRGVYDDYLQRKRKRELDAETAALAALNEAELTAAARVAKAEAALDASKPDAAEQDEQDRLFVLGKALFDDVGLQLSVKLYGASGWERGANLDRVDTPLNDAAWIKNAMTATMAKSDEPARVAALQEIAHWSAPAPGVLYDDLGDPTGEPHLVRGEGWQRDPEFYKSAIDGIADRTLGSELNTGNVPWRLSWLDYAETLYETPLELRYTALDPHKSYLIRVTYAGEDYALPLRLMANGVEVHAARLRKSNPETVEFALPMSISPNGTMTLQWIGPAGSGGSGRGRQVAEVWLIPQPAEPVVRPN